MRRHLLKSIVKDSPPMKTIEFQMRPEGGDLVLQPPVKRQCVEDPFASQSQLSRSAVELAFDGTTVLPLSQVNKGFD